ncbi:DUF6270 domain-containing protein [Cupriavidus alkaliphilus]|uniref:Uncharacterized protein n=1 Tax=Cupriavidus alkaliphilus TaxID=942866 RepID=A0A7W4VDY8_9BURK|nr:DUF6270 domain-containing protein [Cupriavidus alkaliphilus]MBB3009220.1 hypothetical protein [Cupriavidus alkaliphilus]
MKVFILGSCVSRDVFNHAGQGEFEIVDYVARSSISSMFAGKPFEDTFSNRLNSKFQARMVNLDIVKQARYRLATVDADVILIDLIDERFNLVEVENARYCTASSEFIATGALAELPSYTLVPSGSERFLRLWKAGWRSLVQLLESRGKLPKVRVNKVFWQAKTSSGADFPKISANNVDAANVTLNVMYEYMATFLEPDQFFEYDESVMRCTDTHDWGPAPFHYCEDFCKEALGYLRGGPRKPKQISHSQLIAQKDARPVTSHREIRSKFQALPSPYTDFMALSFASPAAAATAARAIIAGLASEPLTVRIASPFGVPDAVLVLGNGSQPIQRQDGAALYSGYGMARGRFTFGQAAWARTCLAMRDMGGEVGQFTGLDMERGGIFAETDLFGHGQLFVSSHQGCAAISNRSHLHCIVLNAMGEATELHEQAVLSLLFSNNTFHSQQPASHQTLMIGVSLLPLDKRASLKEGRLRLDEKRAFTQWLEPSPGRYSELMAQGADEVVSNTRAVLSHPDFTSITLDLSGGKDSRMVFGSALHVEGWQDRIALKSNDVPNSEDLPIACSIAKLFGARFWEGDAVPQDPLTCETNLELWRSYFHGMYHRMGATAWSPRGRNTASMSLSGGNGEVMRTFWSKNLRNYLTSEDTARTLADRLVMKTGVWKGIDKAAAPEIAVFTADAITALPGGILADKLESHYLYLRNRAHFGMRGFTFMHDRPVWFPLMSGALMQAAFSLSLKERESGRLVYDVTQAMHPLLTQIAYDGGNGPTSGSGYTAAKTPLHFELDRDQSAWEAAVVEQRKNAARSRTGPAAMSWPAWPTYVRDSAMAAFTESRDISSVARRILGEEYAARMLREFEVKSRLGFSMASRILAVRDALQ